jgi:hypothetical protein
VNLQVLLLWVLLKGIMHTCRVKPEDEDITPNKGLSTFQ